MCSSYKIHRHLLFRVSEQINENTLHAKCIGTRRYVNKYHYESPKQRVVLRLVHAPGKT